MTRAAPRTRAGRTGRRLRLARAACPAVGAALFLLLACGEALEPAPPDTNQIVEEDVAPPVPVPTVLFEPPQPTSRDAVRARVASPVSGVSYRYSWLADDGTVGPPAELLPAELTTRGQVWRVTVVPDDDPSLAGSGTVVIENAPPVCANAALEPAAPTSGQSVRCVCAGRDDPDDDPPADTCAWSAAGADVGCELPAGLAQKGQSLSCTLSPGDGRALGPAVTVEVVVGNSAPLGGSAQVQPGELREGDVAVCAVDGVSDPDGDALTVAVRWFVDGVAPPPPYDTGATLDGALFDEGQRVACQASASDGALDGGPLEAEGVIVANSLPTVQEARVSPPALYRGDVPECEVIGLFDADPADTPAAVQSWWVNGALRDPLGALGVGDSVVCRAAGLDEAGAGAPVDSLPVVVANHPPTLADVTVSPSAPTTADTLTCAATGAWDTEGDPLEVGVIWTRNGVTLTDETQATFGVPTSAGDVVRCTLTLTDPYGGVVSSVSKPVVVKASPPTLTGVSISPPPTPCATLTCAPVGLADADGLGGVKLEFSWRLDGTPSGTSPTLALAPNTAAKHVSCQITASDNAGSASAEAGAPIQDTPTVLLGVGILPSAPVVGETLTCGVEAYDPDGCEAEVTPVWSVNGQEVTSGASFATAGAAPEDAVTCRAGSLEATVVLGEPSELPLVAVTRLPDHLRCVATPEPADLDQFTWTWWVGDQAFSAGPTLSVPGDCERVRCQAERFGATSNVGELVMPFGPACDDGSPCTADGCGLSGGCSTVPSPGACDDGDGCTVGDACAGGQCSGTPNPCDDGSPCTGSACDDGGCTYAAQAGPCDDGSSCTSADVCLNGACGGTPVACDDLEPCTLDGCSPSGGCTAAPLTGLACDDGSVCTTGDACAAGVCAGDPIGAGTPCTQVGGAPGYCGGAECGANQPPSPPIVALTPKAPIGGDALLCLVSGSIDPDEAPAALTYRYSWRRNGVDLAETVAELTQGVTKGAVITCRVVAFDGALESAAGSATVVVLNAPPSLTSAAVVGAAGGPLSCAGDAYDPDGDVLASSVIWTVDGVTAPAPTAAPACARVRCELTVTDGAAVASATSPEVSLGTGPGCSSTECQTAVCGVAGCVRTAVAGPCDDGDPCTAAGTCAAGACVAGPPLVGSGCDDKNACTADSCVEAECVHTAVPGACDADGSLCTSGDTCVAGLCVAGPTLDCSDGVACTSDACDPGAGCVDALDPAAVGFPVTFIDKAGVPVADGAGLEVVKGIQGGEHVDLGLRLELPPAFTWTPVSVRVVVAVASGCCSGTQFASSTLTAAYFTADGTTVKNTALLTFLGGASSPWVNKPACATVTVSARSQSGATFLAHSKARHGFTLVDLQ